MELNIEIIDHVNKVDTHTSVSSPRNAHNACSLPCDGAASSSNYSPRTHTKLLLRALSGFGRWNEVKKKEFGGKDGAHPEQKHPLTHAYISPPAADPNSFVERLIQSSSLYMPDLQAYLTCAHLWASDPPLATAPFHYLKQDHLDEASSLNCRSSGHESSAPHHNTSPEPTNYLTLSPRSGQSPRKLLLPRSLQSLNRSSLIPAPDIAANDPPLPSWTNRPEFPSELLQRLNRFSKWHIEMLQSVEMRRVVRVNKSDSQKMTLGWLEKRRILTTNRKFAEGSSTQVLTKKPIYEYGDRMPHYIVLQKFTDCTDLERSFGRLKVTINPLLLSRAHVVTLKAKAEQRIREQQRIIKQHLEIEPPQSC